MNTAQIILYNQLREEYLSDSHIYTIYIHNTGEIKFQGKKLSLNLNSKIIDYAGGKQFIESLKEKGMKADFLRGKSFFIGLKQYAELQGIKKYILVKPVEDYVYKNFLKIQKKLENIGIELEFLPDTQSFFLSQEDFKKQYSKPPIMEYFYRFMRKRQNILIDDNGNPEGGQWNYDKENRKFDKNHKKSWSFTLEKNTFVQEAEEYYREQIQIYSQILPSSQPSPLEEKERAASEVKHSALLSFKGEEIQRGGNWIYPTNRPEALKLLDYFCEHHLDIFGQLEDAMYEDDNYVHHSLLSSSINFGFLSAREVVKRVSEADTALNNKEGFIRQILGWREYMYHFFHFYKKEIYSGNHFSHTRSLPGYFWENAELCDMNCLSQTLKRVQSDNHSHHIQRLMIIGNFSLLAGLDPHELNHWFFEYYTDAFEWVVTPNVLAMSQFADGGKLATKPYIASANYINSMSDYCKNCRYDAKEKYGVNACPMNYLYWDFVAQNKTAFVRQPFIVKNLEKIDIEKIKEQKEKFLGKMKDM